MNDEPELNTAAPEPDDERKPETPPEVTKRSWGYVARKTVREFSDDECPDRAGSLTYYGILALFPGLLALASLLAIVGQGQRAIDAVFRVLEPLAPTEVLDTVREPLEQFSASPAAGLGFVTGLVIAVWSASGYVGAFGRAMNRIYEIPEGRPFWKLRPMSSLVTVVALVLVGLIAIVLVVSGPVTDAVGEALDSARRVQVVWTIVKWPRSAVVVVLVVAVLYYATPNVKQPKFRWISIGAVRRDRRAGILRQRGFGALRGELLQLQPDVRVVGWGHRLPAVAVDHESRAAVRAPSSTPSWSAAGSCRPASRRRRTSSSRRGTPGRWRRPRSRNRRISSSAAASDSSIRTTHDDHHHDDHHDDQQDDERRDDERQAGGRPVDERSAKPCVSAFRTAPVPHLPSVGPCV